ncbi:MAG: hypothetical protein NTZ55_05780 [Candidatus Roizmanbacteria bacterium]|nr:hypothetical protein [Candidatus Roizmanbacteria bacterium]
MSKILAQNISVNGTAIQGPLVGYNNIGDIINNVVPFVMALAGIILFFVLMWGGLDYVTSQGMPEKIKSANAKITAGVIGFVLLVLSFLITRVIAYVFGVGQGII